MGVHAYVRYFCELGLCSKKAEVETDWRSAANQDPRRRSIDALIPDRYTTSERAHTHNQDPRQNHRMSQEKRGQKEEL